MDWPSTPIEYRGSFRPSHCPRHDCSEHRRTRPGYRYRRHGGYDTKRMRGIPRFRCLTCRSTYSRTAFTTRYYAKRPELTRPVAAGIVGGSALRQIARTVGAGHATVARIAAKLGRHCMLLHARAHRELRGRLHEAVALDHFESFECTQDWPVGLATVTGLRSWYVYGLDPAPHRRSGRMTRAQRRRRDSRPKRRSRGGYRGSVRRTLDRLLELAGPGEWVRVVSDAHADYPRAIAAHPEGRRVLLEVHANPDRGPKGSRPSPAARLRDRRLFANDLLHKLLRHSQPAHARETISFSRRLNAMVERGFVFLVWRNFIKRRSERKPDPTTPAMCLGLTDERWDWARLLSRRLFFGRTDLAEPLPTLYRRAWTTPLPVGNQRHALRRAF